MAERLKERLLEGDAAVDIVAGPDAYRDLPRLAREAEAGAKGVNVLLSQEETYGEIAPVRLDKNGVSAFISIMRCLAKSISPRCSAVWPRYRRCCECVSPPRTPRI